MKLPRSFLRGATLPRGPEDRTGSSPPRDVGAAHTSAGGAVPGGKQRPDRVDYAVELGAAGLAAGFEMDVEKKISCGFYCQSVSGGNFGRRLVGQWESDVGSSCGKYSVPLLVC